MKIKTAISLFLEKSLLLIFSGTAKKRRPQNRTGKILVARTDGVGDYILWLSAEKEIRKRYPDSRIEMLFDERKPTPQLARYDACIDGCFSLPVVTWRRFLSVFAMSRKEYDVMIQPVYSRLAMTDILLFAAKAHKRITIDTNGQYLTRWELKCSNRGYDVIIKASKGMKHELVRCAELLRGLGIRDFRARLPDISCLTIGKRKLAEEYIMVFPSASWKGKIWEKEKYARVIQWLIREFAGMVYLCGDRRDCEICQWIEEKVNQPQRLKSLAGTMDLARLTAYIKGARMVFGNDTGAVHIAAACRIKTAAVTAAREIGRFMPYQTDDPGEQKYYPVCIYCADLECSGCVLQDGPVCRYQKDMQRVLPCIRNIRTEQVIAALKTCMQER